MEKIIIYKMPNCYNEMVYIVPTNDIVINNSKTVSVEVCDLMFRFLRNLSNIMQSLPDIREHKVRLCKTFFDMYANTPMHFRLHEIKNALEIIHRYMEENPNIYYVDFNKLLSDKS